MTVTAHSFLKNNPLLHTDRWCINVSFKKEGSQSPFHLMRDKMMITIITNRHHHQHQLHDDDDDDHHHFCFGTAVVRLMHSFDKQQQNIQICTNYMHFVSLNHAFGVQWKGKDKSMPQLCQSIIGGKRNSHVKRAVETSPRVLFTFFTATSFS